MSLITKSLGNGHRFQDGDDGDDDNGGSQGGDHVTKPEVLHLPEPRLPGDIDADGEGRGLEGGEAALNLPGQAEHTEVRMGLAAVALRVHHHGDHETDHHHEGVPGGADEPDSLVQQRETATWEPVSQSLYGASITAFFDGFKPASSVESLNRRRVINECPRCGDTINHQL